MATKKIQAFRKSPGEGKAASPAALENFLAGSAMVGRDLDKKDTTSAPTATTAAAEDTSVFKTVNVKLNKRRYQQFKMLSALTGISMQDYLVEGVDETLRRNADKLKNIDVS